jgi:hypothetical protein
MDAAQWLMTFATSASTCTAAPTSGHARGGITNFMDHFFFMKTKTFILQLQ